ncbi:UBP14 [Enterospora canceri]|uniref:UBP14 n=1 Tax=Enterospora canceri TaxID=1081671 RepID=A0A1Y1S546_9MICR|nr:UBP14 [Enterospora canceri]
MQFTIQNVTKECVYCYETAECTSVNICTCGLTVCLQHTDMHRSKFGCKVVCNMKENVNKQIEVSVRESRFLEEHLENIKAIGTGKIEEGVSMILSNMFNSPKDSVFCPHIEQKPIEFEKPAKCSMCEITKNLWKCIGCSFVGCSRKQYGAVGNSHMLEHAKSEHDSNMHKQAIFVSTTNKIYCYECNEFINNGPPTKCVANETATEAMNLLFDLNTEEKMLVEKCNRKIKIHNRHITRDTDFSFLEKYHENIREEDILEEANQIGIVNEGNTCFVSGGLHLLSQLLCKDMSMHFMVCENNPLKCITCQIIKITNKLNNFDESMLVGDGMVDIAPFLDLFYINYTYAFQLGTQADCCEFIQVILEKLKSDEECGLIESVTKKAEYSVVYEIECNACNKTSTRKEGGTVLLLNFAKSVGEALENMQEMDETCTHCNHQAKGTLVEMHVPEELIICLQRTKISNGVGIKILDAVDVEREIYIQGCKYTLKGSIIHKGPTLNSGHYIYYDSKEDVVINDEIVRKTKNDDLEQGYMFIYKKEE